MPLHPLAGQPVPPERRPNIPRLLVDYYERTPDAAVPEQRVSFGTSGHRGTAGDGSFNEEHIIAICQAIVEVRQEAGVVGPLFLGMDTHGLSEAAHATAIEVLAGNGVELYIHESLGRTPTPVISHAILRHNRGPGRDLADGVVITPSHNPPEDGGFKYNPPSGGPADTATTRSIQDRANQLLERRVRGVRRVHLADALALENTHRHDFLTPYVQDLAAAVDLAAIRSAGLRLGTDPLGGSALEVWDRLEGLHGVQVQVVNRVVDAAFAFMPLDHDGKIRMDCSSPYAMTGLVALKDRFDVAFGNDPDADRHGIIVPSAGLLQPNHYLAVAVQYLFQHRPDWDGGVAVGKTLVSSSMIDRVAASLERRVVEVPVGFKWFVAGLLDGSLGFAGEESAGAAFLRRDGTVWTTDKDGILLDLLAAEITAVTERDPGEHYRTLEERFGRPVYQRVDAPATRAEKQTLAALAPEQVDTDTLAGEPIRARLTRAPGNDAPIGGLKVVADNGWFAARPSGTEDIYKIYAESFQGEAHLAQIQEEARTIVERVLQGKV